MVLFLKHSKKDSFKEFILDQLERVGEVECRAMFGGHGLYRRGVFFGILFKGRFYLKTDAESRKEYLAAGMKPFRPNAKMILKTYYEVPPDVAEDPEGLAAWTKKAIRRIPGTRDLNGIK